MDPSFFVGAAGAAVLGFLVAFAGPRLRARQRSLRARRRLGRTHTTLSGLNAAAPVALEGTLRARPGEASASATSRGAGRFLVATTFPRGAELLEEAMPGATTRTSVPLDLAVGDEVVRLEGVQVVVGSRELDRPLPAERVARLLGALAGPLTTAEPRLARALRDGDRVVAAGELREVPSEAPQRYRESVVVRQLTAPANGFVTLAYAKSPRSLRGAPLRYLFAAAVGAALWAALSLASVAGGFGQAQHRSACPPGLDATLNHGNPLEAAQSAEACGDWVRAARGAWQAGEFDRASQAFVQARKALVFPASLTEVGAHLLAGRFNESARAARTLALDGAVGDLANRTMLECYADALDARTGDAAALHLLTARVAAAQTPQVCALLAADLVKGRERIDAIASAFRPKFPGRWQANGYGAGIYDPKDRDDFVFVLLDNEEGGTKWSLRPPTFYPFTALRGAKGEVLFQPLGLEQPFCETRDNEIAADHSLVLATFDSFMGEHRAAAKEASRALALTGLGEFPYGPSAPEGWFSFSRSSDLTDARKLDHRRTFFLGAILAARGNEVGNARTLLRLAPEESNGAAQLNPFLDLLDASSAGGHASALQRIAGAETWAPTKELWVLAADGDGGAIASRLVAGHVDGRGVLPFLGRLDAVSPPLRSFVALQYPPVCWTCGPHALADWVAGRREAAQGLGAAEIDAALRPVAQRLIAAFVRRDISVPLYALGRVASN